MRKLPVLLFLIQLGLLGSGCALFKKKEKIVRPIKIYFYSFKKQAFCRSDTDCISEQEGDHFISLHENEFKKIGIRLEECYRSMNKEKI